MNSTSELIYLHATMARLCRLYIAIDNTPDEGDTIQELRTEIMSIYTEITSIGKEITPQSIH
jgi:hypothetical protein